MTEVNAGGAPIKIRDFHYLGRAFSPVQYFAGQISHVALFNSVLSGSEVSSLYTSVGQFSTLYAKMFSAMGRLANVTATYPFMKNATNFLNFGHCDLAKKDLMGGMDVAQLDMEGNGNVICNGTTGSFADGAKGEAFLQMSEGDRARLTPFPMGSYPD